MSAVDAVLGGLLYSGMQSEGTLGVSSNAVILPRMIYEVVQTAFGFVISSDNRSVAGKNDTLKFGFSEPVNVSLLRNGDLSVSKTEASTVSVAVDFVWDSLNKNLAIAPAFGEWESGQSYTIHIKLHSLLSSKIIDTTLVFLVKEFSDISKDFVRGIKLDNPAVNYNTYSVTLRWNEMKNAEAYEIYTKSSSRFETIYSLTGEVTTKTNGKTDTAFFLQTYNLLINGDSVLVLIAARNGKGKSSFGEPFAIKDNVPPQFTEGPYINPDTANYVINATTYFNGTVNESILPTDINFNEPMDTSAVLSINIPTLTPRPLKAELKWQSTTSLRISFGIGAGTLNEGKEILKIPVTVSGFKDIAGNKFTGTTVGTKTWEGLLILIYADGVPQL